VKLSVIIPVYNGGEGLELCLKALTASTCPPDEIIVVDDASTDASASLAAQLGAIVLCLPDGPRGPARARNQGAAAARGNVLVFLDADVVCHPDTLERIKTYLTKGPEIAALFGSYDADPPAPGLVSRYKNLFHHYTHQHGRAEASTFWAGCGAIRRSVFRGVGGFDESYLSAAVEDIELGARLRQQGYRVRLCPDIQVTHLKRWTFASLLSADIFRRAVPWSRLILRQGHWPRDLNVDTRSRLSALAAWAALFFLVLGLGFGSTSAWWGLGPALMALGALNADLYRFFWRQGGPGFALGAAALHGLYLIYSSLTFAVLAGQAWLRKLSNKSAGKK
jgi:GT2 family glycosyltransferase